MPDRLPGTRRRQTRDRPASSSSGRRRSSSRRAPCEARRSSRQGAPSIARSAGICGSIPCRSWPGRMADPVDMWRGTMQAARSAEFIDGDGWPPGLRDRVGTGSPRTPGAGRSPGTGRPITPRWLAASRHLAPLDRRNPRRRRGLGRRSRGPAASGSTTGSTPRGSPTLRHAAASMARLVRAAGALEILAAATPIVRHRVEGADEAGPLRGVHRASRARWTSGRIAARSSRPTRWARCAWARDPADHAADPRGRVRDAIGRASSRGSTSRTARRSRPVSGSTRC